MHLVVDVTNISHINETFEVENKAFIKSNSDDDNNDINNKKINSYRTQGTNPFKNALMRKQTSTDANQPESSSVNDNSVKFNGCWDRFKYNLESCMFGVQKFDRIKIYFGENPVQEKLYKFVKNGVKTTK